MSNDSNDTTACKGLIAQMEASGTASTSQTIYELNATITGLRGQLIEAQASMSFLQRQTAAAQADERARRDAALESLDTLLDGLNDPQAGLTHSSIRWFVINTIRVLTGQDEEARREEAAGK